VVIRYLYLRRWRIFLCCTFVLLSFFLGAFRFTSIAASKETVVLACSDFQPSNGNPATGQITVDGILSAIKADGIMSADGFLCAGDYATTYTAQDCYAGLAALKDKLDGFVTGNMVFAQGNHDSAETKGLSKGGNNDPVGGAYGVYVIHEDDYSWTSESNEAEVKNTAAGLKTYLDGKAAAKWNKPVFIVSHLQLHYSMRTRLQQDGKYANLLFNVINEAAGKGLNIIFLFGHNHSNGWDDYLGGAAVYLKKGDLINIAQGSTTEFKKETLKFTYMNAGYVGYYGNVNSGSDSTLTMSVFRIVDNEVTVSRYDRNGLHNLKSRGVLNAYKKEDSLKLYNPNRVVYASSRVVTATRDVDVAETVKTTEKVATTAYTTWTSVAVGGTTTTKPVTVDSKVTTTKAPTTTEAGEETTTRGIDNSKPEDTTTGVVAGTKVETTTATSSMNSAVLQEGLNNHWIVIIAIPVGVSLGAGVVFAVLILKKKSKNY